VVLLDANAGRYGFPSEIADDPLLDLVLATSAAYPHAEERRLLYVAITRARHRVFIIASPHRRSTFVEELCTEEYDGLVLHDCDIVRELSCADCGGRVVRREGEHGVFWGCENYPRCDWKAAKCPTCNRAPLKDAGQTFMCIDLDCAASFRKCPKCGIGYVVARHGRQGQFWGCSRWRPEAPSCDFTSNRTWS
jgi:DNA helicase IV